MKTGILTRVLGVYVCLGAIFAGLGGNVPPAWGENPRYVIYLPLMVLSGGSAILWYVLLAWFFWLGLRIAWRGRSLSAYIRTEAILAVPSVALYTMFLWYPTAHITPFPRETQQMFATFTVVGLLPMAVAVYCRHVHRKASEPPA